MISEIRLASEATFSEKIIARANYISLKNI